MLACILRTVYIDSELVAKEYLQQCKIGAWKTENREDALKCWNLERILEAEQFGEVKKTDLRMEELLGELEEDV